MAGYGSLAALCAEVVWFRAVQWMAVQASRVCCTVVRLQCSESVCTVWLGSCGQGCVLQSVLLCSAVALSAGYASVSWLQRENARDLSRQAVISKL